MISMVIFSVIILSTVFIFKESLLWFGSSSGEKKVYSEAAGVLNYMEKYLAAAMCSEKQSLQKIHFKGETGAVRFVAPFYEGKESDIAKFAFYFIENTVKVSVERISSINPDFVFPEDFSGAQRLGENISSFRLEYSDGALWRTSWDTENMEEPCLPETIRITITAYSEKTGGKRIEKTFTKIVSLAW